MRTPETPLTEEISIHALHEESDSVIAKGFIMLKFQSTLSMRRATQALVKLPLIPLISIHALHEESDLVIDQHPRTLIAISIHALHEESDLDMAKIQRISAEFQSTLSMRRATAMTRTTFHYSKRFQSTLSMRRATFRSISPIRVRVFQSTLSMRRATGNLVTIMHSVGYFNPRSP